MRKKGSIEEGKGAKPSRRKDYVMVCPKCKSPQVGRDSTNKAEGALGLPSQYICRDCGFTGYSFPEVDVAKARVSEDISSGHAVADPSGKDSDKAGASDGSSLLRSLLKLAGLVALAAGFLIIRDDISIGIASFAFSIAMLYYGFFR